MEEMDCTAPGITIDVDSMAYESVKNNGIKDDSGIPINMTSRE